MNLNQNKVIQRPEQANFEARLDPSATTFTVKRPVGFTNQTRSISGTVDGTLFGGLNFVDDLDRMGMVARHVADLDYYGITRTLDATHQGAMPFDVAYYPEDISLGLESGARYIVSSVDNVIFGSQQSSVLQLIDDTGVAVPFNANLIGLTVTVKDTLFIKDHELFMIDQNTGAGISISDYTVDKVTGLVTLLPAHLAARTSWGQYCYVLKYTQFARVNESHQEDLLELRSMVEGMEKKIYHPSIEGQNMTARALIVNAVNTQWTTKEIPDPGESWHLKSPWIPVPHTTGDIFPSGNFGYTAGSTSIDAPGGTVSQQDEQIKAKLAVLNFGAELSNIPSNYQIISAKMRVKATRISGERKWRISGGPENTDSNWDEVIYVGRTKTTDPDENFCANFKEGNCIWREWGYSTNHFLPSHDYHSGQIGSIIKGHIGVLDISDPDNWRWNFDDRDNGISWNSNCKASSPVFPIGLEQQAASSNGTSFNSGIRRASNMTEENWFLDYKGVGSETEEPTESNGSLFCHQNLQDMAAFHKWEAPSNEGLNNFPADGMWHQIDVTSIISDLVSNSNNEKGQHGLVIGPLGTVNWNDISLTLNTENVTGGSIGGVSYNVETFARESFSFEYTVEVDQLVVQVNVPENYTPMRPPSQWLSGQEL